VAEAVIGVPVALRRSNQASKPRIPIAVTAMDRSR
jgi:hypothetical protein